MDDQTEMRMSDRLANVAAIVREMEDNTAGSDRGEAFLEFIGYSMGEPDADLRIAVEKLLGMTDEDLMKEFEEWGARTI